MGMLTVTLNPCVDKSIMVSRAVRGRFNQGRAAGDVAGGKGLNAARMLAKLGERVRALTLLGGESGKLVARLVAERDGVELRPVWVRDRTRTIVTVYEEAARRATAYVEPSSEVSGEEGDRLLAAYREALEGVELVACCGSAGQPALDHCYREMIRLAQARGMLTILDSYGEAFRLGLEAGPDLVKPNVAECEQWLGESLPAEADWWRAMRALQGAGAGAVCLSLGRRGALLGQGEQEWRLRSPRVRTVNPVGSGDCLVAGLAYGMVRGWPLVEGAILGVAAGAANAAVWEAAGMQTQQVYALRKRVHVEYR